MVTKTDNNEINNFTVQNDYGAEQIDALEGLIAVRKRPGMYIGSTSQKGVTHLVWEVADNSIDEFVAGFGKDVWFHVAEDATVTVKDNGRGMPVGPNIKFKWPDGSPKDALTVLMTQLHAGGKFNGKDSGYKVSAGLHGVGVKAVNALSDLTTVRVRRDGNIYEQQFSKGEPLEKDPKIVGTYDPATTSTGTDVTYHPDKEIFKQTLFPDCKALQARMAELASLNAGLRIHYKNDATGVETEYYYEDGIIGYTDRLAGEKPRLYDDVIFMKGIYDIKDEQQQPTGRAIIVEIAFTHDDDEKGNVTMKSFANNINTYEGGFHLDGFENAYRKILNKYGNEVKIIKENLSKKFLMEGMNATVSVKVPEAEFEGQTKTKLGNAEAEEAVFTIFEEKFAELIKETKYTDILEAILMKAVKAKEADEAARKARALVKAGNKVKKMALPGKLADCSSTTYSELYIVEGDSAGGSAKAGRDREYQAILALRGKLLNTEKSTIDKLLKSDTIKNIIGAIGAGLNVPGQKFEIDKARYDKVILMTDADIDGAHIKALLLTFFYNYMRPLIEQGMVYASQPPLYRVVTKKGDPKYLANDHELKEYRKKHPNAEVQRFKGLGEMNASQLWETTMDPEKRTLVRITLSDAERATEVFEHLMGEEAQHRRDFIEANAYKVDLSFD